MAKLDEFAQLNNPAIAVLEGILERGYAEGRFRRTVDAVDLHMMISALRVFRVANRRTFETLFQRDMLSPRARDHYRQMVGDMVVGYVTAAA
jgi:TetR/AcrR family transcriptional regulator